MASNQTNIILRDAEQLERRYNPEHDMIPGTPDVTCTDHQLLEMIKRLVIVVDSLQDQIDNHLNTHR
jgi:hypothetical protein